MRRGVAVLALAAAGLTACGGGHNDAATQSTPSASASPTATAAPAAVKTCPLTGVPPRGDQKVNRVALGVKIDNVNDARPQVGIDKADLVVEETVEGGLTRLFAVFQCDSPSSIGPIRSARTSDGDLLRLLNGSVFAFSGANPRVIPQVQSTSAAVLISYDALGNTYFHRDYSRPAPHNVFSSAKTLLGAGLSRDKKLHAPKPLFTYGAAKVKGFPAKTASLTWPDATAGWTWDGGHWLRTQNGTADVLADGHRVSASNVAIMSITTAYTGLHDVLGNASPDDVVTGSGKVWLLRDGHVIAGTWSRPNRTKPLVFKDKNGHVLPLKPGRTWVELLPRPRTPGFSSK
jgi:hypothetical protein